MIDEKIEKYLTEARGEDFYADRRRIAERLNALADRVDNMNLPDPDSDSYPRYRGNAKQILTKMMEHVDALEFVFEKEFRKTKL
jgi:hypothetical protein